MLKQHPNKQNERYWAPFDPEVTVECKEQGGLKVMCWAGVVRGRVFLHWFSQNESVNGQIYLNMLQNVLWPQVEDMRGVWFQQDGAPPHMPARAWLQEKFEGRVISRLTPIPWPAKSPDLSCLDFWFWGVAMAELQRNPPKTIDELKETVESFVESLDEDEVLKVTKHIRKRVLACQAVGGSNFEGNLEKIIKELETNEE